MGSSTFLKGDEGEDGLLFRGVEGRVGESANAELEDAEAEEVETLDAEAGEVETLDADVKLETVLRLAGRDMRKPREGMRTPSIGESPASSAGAFFDVLPSTSSLVRFRRLNGKSESGVDVASNSGGSTVSVDVASNFGGSAEGVDVAWNLGGSLTSVPDELMPLAPKGRLTSCPRSEVESLSKEVSDELRRSE